MKNIAIIFTGGTFSMKIDHETGGAVPHFSGNDLLDLMPGIRERANLVIHDFGKYPGPHMTPDLMLSLAEKVRQIISQPEISGIIITHGTDTLEETAYLIDLTIDTNKPIVLTGSMKNSSEPDWDGPRNLADSIAVCLSTNSEDMGVLVCLNGEVNAASEVTKTHTDDIETFASLDFGSLGFVENGRVIFNRLPKKLEHLPAKGIVTDVDLIKCYAGIDEKFFRFSADSNTKGLVVEALGVGNVPPKAFHGIEYVISKNIPVVLVSRCPAGETLDIYSYPGAGKWLHQLGVIFADYLNGQKARIKLMLALSVTTKQRELKRIFEN
ncbi:MAG: asparaginase [Ignavibacteriaceae bacterium]|nr:asparaginase [Ignavibacteriaceae bacterium]